MAMSITEHKRLVELERLVAELAERLAILEARKKPGPKPKADNATEAAD